MSSAGVAAEEGFLKLVYPKRRVELHRHPITAAQVLERNPRCCVARPDVFKYPWVVVRPESVLSLGRVFYVVPRHTIHRLLQQHGTSSPVKAQKPLQERQSSHPRGEQKLSWDVEITPRRKTYHGDEFTELINSEDYNQDSNYIELRVCNPLNDRELAQFHNSTSQEHHNGQGATSPIKIVNHEIIKEDSDNSMLRQRVRRSSNSNRVYSHIDKPPKTEKQEQRLRDTEPQNKQYPIEHWPISRETNNNYHQQLKPFDSCESLQRNKSVTESSSSTSVRFSRLKSCLKKQTSGSPSLRQLKVSFNEEIEVYLLNERICTS